MEPNKEDKELTKGQQKLLNLLNKFESESINDSYIDDALGSVGKFIDLLEKQNLLQHIDPLNRVWENHENYLLYKKVELDPSYIWSVVDSLSDITKIGDIYYYDTDSETLAGFFNTGRNDISKISIEEIIDGNYEMNHWDVTDDEYRDIYLELNPEVKYDINSRRKNIGSVSINPHFKSKFEEGKEIEYKDYFEFCNDYIDDMSETYYINCNWNDEFEEEE